MDLERRFSLVTGSTWNVEMAKDAFKKGDLRTTEVYLEEAKTSINVMLNFDKQYERSLQDTPGLLKKTQARIAKLQSLLEQVKELEESMHQKVAEQSFYRSCSIL